ncbi:MAG: oligoendopeptidase F [Deltaproteobacteria bacterium]|nr:oligoendopeptidase F [Deltaproteobacteria bacterium]
MQRTTTTVILVTGLVLSSWSMAGTTVKTEANMAASAKGKSATTPERKDVEEALKWNLKDLYADQAAWEKDLKKLEGQVKAFKKYKGKLNTGASKLRSCLDDQFDIIKRLYRLSSYARRLHDQDAGDALGQQLHERIGQVGTRMGAAMSFVEPEILAIPAKKFAGFAKTKALAKYKHYLDNTTRLRKHTLSPKEEEIVARAGDLLGVPYDIYQTMSTLNLPFAEVTLKDGQKVKLSQAMYGRYRATTDRADRIKVFQAFWQTYKDFRETLAGLLSGAVKRDHFVAGVRGYKTDLDAALGATNVPTNIYTNMIEQVRAGRPLLWRYLKLRKKALGLKELGYHDLYTSIIPSVDMPYPYEKAKGVVLESLAPLGKDYVALMQKAFDERWTDVLPTKGKRSGAYMSGSAYDVHPYVLLNHNDNYNSMSTLAHEFGHAGHSYYSNRDQDFHNSDYPIFIAEVASITNESLLRLFVSSKEKDLKKKLFLLGEYLESWRTTVFRQALFAEFELKIHQMAQDGKPLTADLLDKTYLSLLREYYGEKEGVCTIDPLYAVEWSFIPHFFYNFYMFQYTTSFIASTAIALKIHGGDTKARDNYLSMLSAGGSRYPVALLKMAGVDMSGAEPYKVAFESMEKALDEVEKLMEKK